MLSQFMKVEEQSKCKFETTKFYPIKKFQTLISPVLRAGRAQFVISEGQIFCKNWIGHFEICFNFLVLSEITYGENIPLIFRLPK